MNQPDADPPGMPEDERMTAAEFRIAREGLGLPGDWIATQLRVNPRTVRSWEQGRFPIPDFVRRAMEEWEHRTGAYVSELVPKLMDLPEPGLLSYRTDEELHAAHPEVEFPASWHRRVLWRILQEVPGVPVVYADEVPDHAERDSELSGIPQ